MKGEEKDVYLKDKYNKNKYKYNKNKISIDKKIIKEQNREPDIKPIDIVNSVTIQGINQNTIVLENTNKHLPKVKEDDKEPTNVLQVKTIEKYDQDNNKVELSFEFDKKITTAIINRDDLLKFDEVEESLNKEFDSYFEQVKGDLDELKEKQDDIIKKVEVIVETDELEDEQIILDILLEQLNSIRYELQVLEESLNFDNIYKFGNQNFNNLINKYTSILNNNEIIAKQMDSVRKSKVYLEIDETLKNLEDDNLKVSLFCKLKMNEYEERDKDFLDNSKKIEELDDITKDVSKLVGEQDKIIKELDEKLKNSVSSVEHVEYIMESSRHALQNLLLSMAAANMIQNSGLRTAVMVGETFRFMNAIMNPRIREERTLRLEVIDYSDEIGKMIDDVSAVSMELLDMKNQVKDITDYFNKTFKEYIDVIPEYKEVLEQLQNVSDIIDEQYELVNINSDTLEEQYAKNYEKVKLRQDFD